VFVLGNHRSVGIFRAKGIIVHPEQSIHSFHRRRRLLWMRMYEKYSFDTLLSEDYNNSQASHRCVFPGTTPWF
jgi:hypothetical protein